VEQDDLSGIVVGPEHEDLRQERADLLRRKVDDRDDPAADQVTLTTPMRMSTFSKSGNRSAVRMPGAPGGWPESGAG